MWKRNTTGECFDKYMDIIPINNSSTIYNFKLIGLEEDSSYIITVAENNRAGKAVSDPVIGTTMEAGKELNGNL